MDGINSWRHKWKAEGWTRKGKPLANADLWRMTDRILATAEIVGLSLEIKQIPSHVGIYGNEMADRLAKAATQRGHKAKAQSIALQNNDLDAVADEIVSAILNQMR